MPFRYGPGQPRIEEGTVRPGNISEIKAPGEGGKALQKGLFGPLGPQRRLYLGPKAGIVLPFPAQKDDLRRAGKFPGLFQGQGQGALAGKYRFPSLGRQAAGE
jgi:hypothetical protein